MCGTPNKHLRRSQLLRVATRVFGSVEAATVWLNTPQPFFADAVPWLMTDTAEGFQRVLEELELLGS
jgi:uncharacterized protein (DUF2384 family)